MQHQIKCTIRVFDQKTRDLLGQFDEVINRLYSVASSVAIPDKKIVGQTTVGKEYILEVTSKEQCHQVCCDLRCRCPAPFEVMMYRSHWTVEKVNY